MATWPLPPIPSSHENRRFAAWFGAALAAHLAALGLVTRHPAPVEPGMTAIVARIVAAEPRPEIPQPEARPRPTPPRPAPVRTPAPAPTVPVAAAPSPAAAEAAAAAPASVPSPAASTTPSAPTEASSAPPLISKGIEYLRPPAPVYPRAARSLGEQGRVLLKVLVDTGGQPREVEIVESSGYLRLDGAARAAVAQSLFKPYREGSRILSMWALVPISFQLDR